MIIHNPDITGSLSFPRADGTKVVMQISSQGVLETVEKDTNGDLTANKPASDFSGSFTGSFLGDGSLLTGVAASSLNIDLFNAGTISGDDEILFSDTSDSGNEKRATFQSGLTSVGVLSGSQQIVDILHDNTVISGSSQLLNVATDFGTGRVSGDNFGDLEGTSTFTGSFRGDGSNLDGVTSYTDSDNTAHLNSLDVVSGSATQVRSFLNVADGATNYGDTNVKTKLTTEDVVSGSASDVRTFLNVADGATNYGDTNVKTKLTAEDVVSGSASDVRSFLNISDGATNYGDTNVKTKLTTEDVVSGSASEVRTFLNVENNADVTDATNVTSALVAATGISSGNKTTIQSNLGVDAAGTDNSTDVTLDDSSYDYLSISGQQITLGQVDASSDISNLTTANVSEVTNLYYTDTRVKTKLTAEDVVSGSATQVRTFLNVENGATADQTAGEIRTLLGTGNNGVIPTAGSAGQFLKHDGTFGTPSYTTNTDTDVSEANLRARLADITEDVTIGDATDVDITFAGGVTVSGNLTVSGTTTTVNSNTVNIGDNILVLNSDEAGTPSQDGGIEIERGTATNASLIWDESSDYFVAGLKGSESRIVIGAGNTSITTLGTITTGTWQGTAIADAYLSSNTAHLSGTQTFSGAKTFSAAVNITNSTASTNKTTGALKVTGGVGISGALNVGGDVVAYASSDERLKDNIELISNPIEKVQSLKGVTWNWNNNADELQQSLPNVGVIAQDVEKVLPQLVHDRDNGFKGVDYAKLTGLLIEAIKEQQKQIDELKSKLK